MASSPALVSVTNFRDLGGHGTRDGRRVVMGRLFRSAHYSHVTAEDIAALDQLAVKLLVDLRQRHEREQFPNRWSPPRVIFRDPEQPLAMVPDPAALDQTAEYGHNAMADAYGRFPYEPRFIFMFRGLFHHLADEGGPVIIHCAAGKDRTGLACALVLDALGVNQEAIFADYLLTNASIDPVERAKIVRARLGEHLSDEAIAPLLGVERGYLQASIDTIRAKSGSMAAYVSDVLAIPDEALARMREALIA